MGWHVALLPSPLPFYASQVTAYVYTEYGVSLQGEAHLGYEILADSIKGTE